jgi:serine/threonine protein phosphatase PrpC
MRHILARAVGVEPEIEIEAVAGELEAGDRFLLCSDGLTGPLDDAEIAGLADLPLEAEALDALIGLTIERGAPDNVTVVIVSVAEITRLVIAPPAEAPAP